MSSHSLWGLPCPTACHLCVYIRASMCVYVLVCVFVGVSCKRALLHMGMCLHQNDCVCVCDIRVVVGTCVCVCVYVSRIANHYFAESKAREMLAIMEGQDINKTTSTKFLQTQKFTLSLIGVPGVLRDGNFASDYRQSLHHILSYYMNSYYYSLSCPNG